MEKPGDWRIAVGDEVKAAFQQLCANPHARACSHTPHMATAFTNTRLIYTANREIGRQTHRHTDGHKEK